jgi:8-oxo-dGTP pyrophosphatase MutT (NUDIX family)
VIRAGGAVLWRPAPGGGLEVAVIHRPRYDDWTLPKGKVRPGEDEMQAALREVTEETGQRARPGPGLGEVRYRQVRKSVEEDKVVRYWGMRALGGAFTPNDEVDELRWLDPGAVLPLLTYDRDREVLQRFLDLGRGAGPAED